MKHTPGPWSKHPHSSDKPFSVCDGNGDCWVAYSIVIGAGEKIVASADMSTHDAGWDKVKNRVECEANAHLIAAAPELLEALELVADSTAVLNHLPVETQEFICAAIAKAKGE